MPPAMAAPAAAAADRAVYLPPAPLAAFAAALDAQPSATRALTQWCTQRRIAGPDPAEIVASPVPGPALPLSNANRRLLGIAPDEPVGFRHVRLSCGGAILSEAFNWYVPARLTASMNATLESTRTPFGTVAASLGFSREPLSRRHGRAPGCPPGTVLANRAVLRLPDGRGLALVLECYTRANLAAVLRAPIAPSPPRP